VDQVVREGRIRLRKRTDGSTPQLMIKDRTNGRPDLIPERLPPTQARPLNHALNMTSIWSLSAAGQRTRQHLSFPKCLANRCRNGLMGEQRATTRGNSQGKAIEVGSPSLNWISETVGDIARSVLLVPLGCRKSGIEVTLHLCRRA
jgi:hypothetical protein